MLDYNINLCMYNLIVTDRERDPSQEALHLPHLGSRLTSKRIIVAAGDKHI